LKFTHRSLPLKEIVFDDHTFCLSYPCRAMNLISSIDLVGIINPPVVREVAEGYQIVCGRGRLEAARKLGHAETICKVLPPWVDDLSCLAIAFEENITTRGFNLVEKALVVEKFLNYLPDEEVIKNVLPRLGLKPHYHHLETLQKINFLEDEAKKLLATEELNPQVAVKLLDWDEKSRQSFLKLVSELRLSFSRQREILELLEDWHRKEGLSPAEILEGEEIRECLIDEKLNPPQKAERLQQILRERLYPTLEEAKKRLETINKKLAREGARLRPSPSFEKNFWRLEVIFQNVQELQEKWPQLLAQLSHLED